MTKPEPKTKINNKKSINMSKPDNQGSKQIKLIKRLRNETTKISTPEIQEVKPPRFRYLFKLILVIATGTAFYLVAYKYRGLFLSGTVNSTPIYRWELNQKMSEKYAKQTLEEIVNEKILSEQLKKNNISITDQEVSDEITKIISDYGSEDAFKAALTQYGLTEVKAKESIRQSLGLKKLIEKNYTINITDDMVKKYFDDNKTLFGGKKFEQVSQEIRDSLYQQEIYAKTQEWFTSIRQSAKITTFI